MAEERAVSNIYSGTNGPSQQKERRIFKRYPLSLAASIINSQAIPHPYEIRDFCVGGMLLVDTLFDAGNSSTNGNQLSTGEVIEVHCSAIDITNPEVSIEYVFISRIVRSLPGSIGISFIDPDAAAIQGLINYAQQSDALLKPCRASNVERTALHHADIVAECTSLVMDKLDPMIEVVIENTIEALFKAAKETKNIVEQNCDFEAIGIINDLKKKIVATYKESVIDRVVNYIPGMALDQCDNKGFDEISLESMSIVEDDVLDDWLADSGTIESVEREHKSALADLEKRLSVIYDVHIDRVSNPFGPALFSHSFQDVIHGLDLKHNVEMAWYKTFRETLIFTLGSLYEDMNALLIDYDILPQLKYEIRKVNVPPDPQHIELSEKQPPQQETPEVVADHQQKNQTVGGDSNNAETDVDSAERVTEAVNITDVSKMDNAISSADIYELMDELKTLKQQLYKKPLSHSLADSDPVVQLHAEQRHPFTQNEVLTAISKLKFEKGLERAQIKSQLESLLSSEDDTDDKVIGKRESQIVDVSGYVFDNLMDDQLVPENIRGWIKELELPVLKMAIKDDRLFKDRNNLVRQVVNKIAKLGLLVEEEVSTKKSGIRNALDWLVNLINSEGEGSAEVFDRVSGQLDLLIKAQDSKYNENIKRTIASFKTTVDDTPDYELPVDEFLSEDELELWRRKARRLEEGTWVLFNATSQSPQRLRAGWIAQHTNKIVFVNLAGEKAKIIHFDKFASILHSGDAVILDDANEPAMDRAQYSMLQDMHQQLVHESTHDQLTGLINRREFEKRIGETLTSARHSQIRNSLCFIDFDQFNVINTTCGYEAGDKLLIDIAGLLQTIVKDKGTAARLGGDEFGVLLEDSSIDGSLDLCDDIIKLVREHKFMWNDKRITAAISIGMVSVSEKSESITSLMQSAQASCRIAKEMGGNRVQLYREGHDRMVQRSEIMSWMSQIDDILDGNKLSLRCQRIHPIFEPAQAPHYEILLAMSDSNGVPVSIQDFVQAAEWGNRITDVDRWVVTNTLKWIAENKTVLDTVSVFSINLSGRSLSDPGLVEFVLGEIEHWDVPPTALCFEITETAGVENLSDTADFIQQIKQSGCHFSLDDFGSGMSSYAYLKNLPVDYLKIDGAFVKDIAKNISDYAVVKSICEIGHFMGKRVIAEFAENETTVNMLKEIGVDYVQGFGIARPCNLAELLI